MTDLERKPSMSLTDCAEANTGKIVASSGSIAISSIPLNLTVKCLTWPVDIRGLLHHKSPAVCLKEFRVRSVQETYTLSRSSLNVDMINETTPLSTDYPIETTERLLSLSVDNGSVVAHRGNGNENKPDTWLYLGKSHHSIDLETIIRFGSFKVHVADLVLTEDEINSRGKIFAQLDIQNGFSPSSSSEEDGNKNDNRYESPTGLSVPDSMQRLCRICFDVSDPKDPLIRPCKCDGSVKYIHISCLKHWIDGQLQVKKFPGGGGSYCLRTICCEICKFPYSKSTYENCLIDRPDGPHIVLEEQPILLPASSSSSNHQRVNSIGTSANLTVKIHVLPLSSKRPLKIGRSKESDIILSDISVSRQHALLRYKLDKSGSGRGTVMLEDKGSKFGSLLALPRKFSIASTEPTCIQIGNTLISINVSQISRWFERLFVPKRFQSRIGQVRLIKERKPNVDVLEKEIERRTRSSSAHLPQPAAMPLTLPPMISQQEPIMTQRDNVEEMHALISPASTTRYRDSPLGMIEGEAEEDPGIREQEPSLEAHIIEAVFEQDRQFEEDNNSLSSSRSPVSPQSVPISPS